MKDKKGKLFNDLILASKKEYLKQFKEMEKNMGCKTPHQFIKLTMAGNNLNSLKEIVRDSIDESDLENYVKENMGKERMEEVAKTAMKNIMTFTVDLLM